MGAITTAPCSVSARDMDTSECTAHRHRLEPGAKPREYTRRIMKRRLACVLLVLGVAGVTTSFDSAAAVQNRGRYKKQGNACLWDPNDSGPNQCTPVTGRGRFKKDGDKCLWRASDKGPDQCRPATGRFKKE